MHPEPITVDWDVSRAQKSGYDTFMRKEIDEQPAAIRDTLVGRVDERPSPARRAARERRRPARGLEGVRGGLRHRVPLGHGGEVRDRALDPGAGRDRDRERVPLPRPGPRPRHPHARRLAVGRDDRHARGRPSRAPSGLAGDRRHEHGRQHALARGRRRHLHARRPGDRRRGHEDLRDADGVAAPGRAVPRAGARLDVPGGDRRGPRPDGGAARGRSSGRCASTLSAWSSPSGSATRATCSSSGGTPATRPRSRAR